MARDGKIGCNFSFGWEGPSFFALHTSFALARYYYGVNRIYN
jgi:hypothetical protein